MSATPPPTAREWAERIERIRALKPQTWRQRYQRRIILLHRAIFGTPTDAEIQEWWGRRS